MHAAAWRQSSAALRIFCEIPDPGTITRQRVAHCARWIPRESELTDGELIYLATGSLDHEPEE